MTMHIDLSPEMESFVRNKVEGGFYGNATEVIHDAIRRMQAEEIRLNARHAAIKKGSDQLDAGEGIDYTKSLMDDVTREAVNSMHTGEQADPDVLP